MVVVVQSSMSIGKVLAAVAKLPSFFPSKIGRYIENRCQMGACKSLTHLMKRCQNIFIDPYEPT